MIRDFDYFAARVVYPSIFARSVDGAAEHLANLIANQLCGFEEGTDVWRAVLDRFARSDDPLNHLEIMGRRMSAPFTRAEWRDVAEKTLHLLDRAADE